MDEIAQAVTRIREPVYVVRESYDGSVGIAFGGEYNHDHEESVYKVLGILPALYPEWLGDRAFCEVHGLRFPYAAGAMANGIASAKLVIGIAHAGMLGFLGSAGLRPNEIEKCIEDLEKELGAMNLPYGSNLIHSPSDPALEDTLVDLYLRRSVKKVDASAYMRLTPAVVRYSVSGLQLSPDGQIIRRNHLFAKISRPEVAEHFMSPAPDNILKVLHERGQVSEEEARLASNVPLSEDIIVEADSGGHTDNRPLAVLFSTIAELRENITKQYGYSVPIRIGAAGGLGTPMAVASAFSLGASFVMTGSINQAAIEANTSSLAKVMLAKAGMSDFSMAPSADMFELGAKVQVLKRGTMWAVRAQKLYELYRSYKSFDEIPETQREQVERDIFRGSFENIWVMTKKYFEGQDKRQIERAEEDAKHKMALVFRWYLGMGSRWAMEGQKDRIADYQIWCGPAQGAFNNWVKGSFLEPVESRSVVQMALNLMEGASVITRAHQLRSYGVPVPNEAFEWKPRKLR
jgi:PfaD family protein